MARPVALETSSARRRQRSRGLLYSLVGLAPDFRKSPMALEDSSGNVGDTSKSNCP